MITATDKPSFKMCPIIMITLLYMFSSLHQKIFLINLPFRLCQSQLLFNSQHNSTKHILVTNNGEKGRSTSWSFKSDSVKITRDCEATNRTNAHAGTNETHVKIFKSAGATNKRVCWTNGDSSEICTGRLSAPVPHLCSNLYTTAVDRPYKLQGVLGSQLRKTSLILGHRSYE
jgi:hypothetical protein